MLETIPNGMTREGFVLGKAEGKVEEKINDITKTLRFRHKQVSDSIVAELNRRTDLIALESLFEVALQCDTIDEFEEALK